MERDTGRSRGFGFVTLSDSEAFHKALDLDGTVMVILSCGCKLLFSLRTLVSLPVCPLLPADVKGGHC